MQQLLLDVENADTSAPEVRRVLTIQKLMVT